MLQGYSSFQILILINLELESLVQGELVNFIHFNAQDCAKGEHTKALTIFVKIASISDNKHLWNDQWAICSFILTLFGASLNFKVVVGIDNFF